VEVQGHPTLLGFIIKESRKGPHFMHTIKKAKKKQMYGLVVVDEF
jgi:hypothetical protein